MPVYPGAHNLRRLYRGAVGRAGPDLAHLQLHGPHDLRHTFSTWLEDADIPTRVIDELMGHADGRRGGGESGSRVGARYRHTTPEMAVGWSRRSKCGWRSCFDWPRKPRKTTRTSRR